MDSASNDGKIWSLMGFVLAREDTASTQPQKPYDVFIVFRGSRSGRVSSARMPALSSFRRAIRTGSPIRLRNNEWTDSGQFPSDTPWLCDSDGNLSADD